MPEPTADTPTLETTQPPVVFTESEAVPLGFTNKLLRKAAYGCGILSFTFTGLSGVSSKNHWRTAAGFGSAGINAASLLLPEHDDELPNASIPCQMVHAIAHPNQNTLFFNRSASFITDVLKFASGLESARKSEIMEGVWKIGTKAVDIAGISDQDKREKIAAKEPVSGAEVVKKPSPLREIFANRWVSLSNSAVAAGLQIAQGLERRNKKFVVRDQKMLLSGIFYLMAVSSLFADNAIMESNIKKTSERGR